MRKFDDILIAQKNFVNCNETTGLRNYRIFLCTIDISEKPVKVELRSEEENK